MWFTSDLHFGHKNILKYMLNRKFDSIEEHDEYMLDMLNETIGPKEDVYFLGDLAMRKDVSKILPRLPGKWHMILGNHCYWAKKPAQKEAALKLSNIVEILDYKEIRVNKMRYVLFHYPIETFNRRSVQLHGHTHSLEKVSGPNRIHVGIDAWDLKPVHIDELQPLIVDFSQNVDT